MSQSQTFRKVADTEISQPVVRWWLLKTAVTFIKFTKSITFALALNPFLDFSFDEKNPWSVPSPLW